MITRHSGLIAVLTFALLLGVISAVHAAQLPGTRIGETDNNPKDGAVMVWVPAGDFIMGTSNADIAAMLRQHPSWKTEWFAVEKPRHTVSLDGYWVYKYTVTVAQFRKFCAATNRKMPEQQPWSKDNFPVVNVTWFDASAYADWAGAALPTEAQWEKAARGTDGRYFPWGNLWDQEKCNNYTDHQLAGGGLHGDRAAAVGSYPASASPYGAQDMAGNVWEWCQDWFAPDYYAHTPKDNPTGPETGEMKVLRGGSWGSSAITIRSAGRHMDAPDLAYHDCGGFRCVVMPDGDGTK